VPRWGRVGVAPFLAPCGREPVWLAAVAEFFAGVQQLARKFGLVLV